MPDPDQVDRKRVRYVYLDVVAFTRDRSIEAQSDIVATLNNVVLTSVSALDPPVQNVLYLPTGDGLGVALLDEPGQYDHHLQLGLQILSQISKRNVSTQDPMRRFEVRIGVNENTDNIVTDINGHLNVAGAGISVAQRVMSEADASQILVGPMVFETLIYREKYMRKFRSYQARDKHGVDLVVHQFVEEGHEGLITTPPSAFVRPDPAPRPLTELEAHYLALAIKHRQFLAQHSGSILEEHALTILLWFLANDALRLAHATDFNRPLLKTFKEGSGLLEEALNYYLSQDPWICSHLMDYLRTQLSGLTPYLEWRPGGGIYVVKPTAQEKLRQEYPKIFQDIGISVPGA